MLRLRLELRLLPCVDFSLQTPLFRSTEFDVSRGYANIPYDDGVRAQANTQEIGLSNTLELFIPVVRKTQIFELCMHFCNSGQTRPTKVLRIVTRRLKGSHVILRGI